MITKLYDTFQPKHYDIELSVDSDALQFTGTVSITGTVLGDTNVVPLHAKDLTILKTKINSVDTSFMLEPQDVVAIDIPKEGTADNVVVEVSFEGKITDDMSGMYPCYFEHEGKKKWLVATQFESHHAREVFPCVDEPAAKATFRLTLLTKEGLEVISNTPSESQAVVENENTSLKLRTRFETTPRMSTYLLAFVAGEMHYKEAKTKDGVVVRSWASLAQPADHLDFSLHEAVKIIEFYNEYFETPYPLKKCDQVALPDFDAGAMENWGLITYRETALLTDPSNPSVSTNQYVAIVIAHELSHQWFGNLVTMKWWDDLWLNESFASLMEYIAVDKLHPEWQMWEHYTASDAIVASNRDVYSDVQPVRVDVNDPAEISTLFDGAIVYAKGGRLLKMLREFIGDDAFRNGLANYFKKHAYQNTTRDDLWQTMSTASGQNINELMDSWLEQSGLPILTISQEYKNVAISQQRLLLDGKLDDDQLWHIPLLANRLVEPHVLTEKEATWVADSEDILLLNQYGSGHFVTKYETQSQQNHLQTRLKDGSIPTEGRIVALNDAILLARAGKSSLTESLTLVQKLSNEERDNVWSLMASIIGNARTLTEGDEEAETRLKQLTNSLAVKWYEKLGWEFSDNEDANTTQLRTTILGMMVSSEQPEVIDKALKQYKIAKPEHLHAEIRSLLMSVAVRFGDEGEIDTLLELLRTTQSAELQLDICSALCSTKDIKVATRLTELMKDKSVVRPQDLIRWYAYLLRNKHSREIMWQWTISNWDWLLDVFKSSKSYDYLPRYAANFMNSEAWLEQYKNFFEPKLSDPALTRTIKVGIKEIEARVAWRKRDENAIREWLLKTVR